MLTFNFIIVFEGKIEDNLTIMAANLDVACGMAEETAFDEFGPDAQVFVSTANV